MIGAVNKTVTCITIVIITIIIIIIIIIIVSNNTKITIFTIAVVNVATSSYSMKVKGEGVQIPALQVSMQPHQIVTSTLPEISLL